MTVARQGRSANICAVGKLSPDHPMVKPYILVLGSSNTDMVIKLDRLPRPGETVLGGEFVTVAGGKGANQAVAAARAGGLVKLVARVGRDMFGEESLARFMEEGIHVENVVQDESCPSGVAMICVAKDGENSIAVAAGANGRLSPADVKEAGLAIAGASMVLLQLETPLATVQAAVEAATAAGVPVLLNPAPACALPGELLRRVSILTPNETETELLTGIAVTDEESAARAAEKLREMGPQTVIITLGDRGAFVASGSSRRLVPGFQVTAVDTTGAGDIFNGALAVALGEGRPLLESVSFANAAAAISVTRFGAQPSAPMRKEIDLFLTQAESNTVPPLAATDVELVLELGDDQKPTLAELHRAVGVITNQLT
jgi:ribokinase